MTSADAGAGGDKDRRLFYIWIHVGMVPEGEGMQKQYVQRFTRSELDKLDKSASVSRSSSSFDSNTTP